MNGCHQKPKTATGHHSWSSEAPRPRFGASASALGDRWAEETRELVLRGSRPAGPKKVSWSLCSSTRAVRRSGSGGGAWRQARLVLTSVKWIALRRPESVRAAGVVAAVGARPFAHAVEGDLGRECEPRTVQGAVIAREGNGLPCAGDVVGGQRVVGEVLDVRQPLGRGVSQEHAVQGGTAQPACVATLDRSVAFANVTNSPCGRSTHPPPISDPTG